jgi:integrase/recombinase XerD
VTSLVSLADMADTWYVVLEAEGKSAQTIRAYRAGVEGFIAWYAGQGGAEPVLDRPAVAAYVADLLRSGQSAGTARLRVAALRLFSQWLAEEDPHHRDQLAKYKPPKDKEPEVDGLSDAQLEALIRACRGTRFADRRDEALVRLMAETGVRIGGAMGMKVADLDMVERTARVVLKGGRPHTVGPLSAKTVLALKRYLAMRRSHRLAHTPALWLGEQSRPFGYQGAARALGIRAARAVIAGFHPHRLRHTSASRWLDAGGSEGGLMQQMGWRDRSMLDRYVRDTAARRAREEAARLNLGDIG